MLEILSERVPCDVSECILQHVAAIDLQRHCRGFLSRRGGFVCVRRDSHLVYEYRRDSFYQDLQQFYRLKRCRGRHSIDIKVTFDGLISYLPCELYAESFAELLDDIRMLCKCYEPQYGRPRFSLSVGSPRMIW